MRVFHVIRPSRLRSKSAASVCRDRPGGGEVRRGNWASESLPSPSHRRCPGAVCVPRWARSGPDDAQTDMPLGENSKP